mgnify:CR=1 FL=1
MSRAGGQTDIEPETGPQEKTKREVQDSASRGVLLAVLLVCRRGENSHWPVPPSLQTRRLKTGIICCMIGKDEIRREADGP